MQITVYPKKIAISFFCVFTFFNVIYSFYFLTDPFLKLRIFVTYLALTLLFVFIFSIFTRLELKDNLLIIRGDTIKGFKKFPLPIDKIARVETQIFKKLFMKQKLFFVYFQDVYDVKAIKLNDKFYFLVDLESLFEQMNKKYNIEYTKQ